MSLAILRVSVAGIPLMNIYIHSYDNPDTPWYTLVHGVYINSYDNRAVHLGENEVADYPVNLIEYASSSRFAGLKDTAAKMNDDMTTSKLVNRPVFTDSDDDISSKH